MITERGERSNYGILSSCREKQTETYSGLSWGKIPGALLPSITFPASSALSISLSVSVCDEEGEDTNGLIPTHTLQIFSS